MTGNRESEREVKTVARTHSNGFTLLCCEAPAESHHVMPHLMHGRQCSGPGEAANLHRAVPDVRFSRSVGLADIAKPKMYKGRHGIARGQHNSALIICGAAARISVTRRGEPRHCTAALGCKADDTLQEPVVATGQR